MNKKNTFLILLISALSATSILPTAQDKKRVIRKELYSNYENNRINIVTLSEAGLSVTEVIDRDICILYEHKNDLLNKVHAYKKSWSPFFNKLHAGFFGTVSAIAASSYYGAVEYIRAFAENGIFLKSKGNWFHQYALYYQLSDKNYPAFISENLQNKVAKNPEIMEACHWVLPAYIAALVTGGICAKKIYDIYKYPCKLNAFIKKACKRLERDQAIINQLKEIKYSLEVTEY